MEERFKFRHVNKITGTVVLVIVVMLLAALVWTGCSQRWFRSRVTLRIVLPEAGAAAAQASCSKACDSSRVGLLPKQDLRQSEIPACGLLSYRAYRQLHRPEVRVSH